MARHGKLVDLTFGASQHLVVSFGRHGWARWTDTPDAGHDTRPTTRRPCSWHSGSTTDRPSNSRTRAIGCRSDVGSSTILPRSPRSRSSDPIRPIRHSRERSSTGRRRPTQAGQGGAAGQESLAGIGNAYSDEILHLAKLSPVGHAAALTATSSSASSVQRSASSQTPSRRSEGCRSRDSRRPRSPRCAYTAEPARPARYAVTPFATSPSRARQRSTARRARPAVRCCPCGRDRSGFMPS